jgi:hypothetical protein
MQPSLPHWAYERRISQLHGLCFHIFLVKKVIDPMGRWRSWTVWLYRDHSSRALMPQYYYRELAFQWRLVVFSLHPCTTTEVHSKKCRLLKWHSLLVCSQKRQRAMTNTDPPSVKGALLGGIHALKGITPSAQFAVSTVAPHGVFIIAGQY